MRPQTRAHSEFSPVISLLAPAWSPTVLNVPEGCTLLSAVACDQDTVINSSWRAEETEWVRDTSCGMQLLEIT